MTCANIPGLICAAEHYDLPELLQACFHHAKQFLRIEVVCVMLCSLENYYWRYTSASELVNMILAFVETRAHQASLEAKRRGWWPRSTGSRTSASKINSRRLSS